MDIGLLVLRLVVGLTLASHGAQKLFGWFGGYGIAGTGGFFESIGFRPGKVQAVAAGLAELGGGLLLALGLVTPIGSVLVLSVMLVALVSVHWPKGFFMATGGIEYTLVLAGAAVALAFSGPGTYSLDGAIGLTDSGWLWGLGVVAAGVLGSTAALLARRPPAPAAAEPLATAR
jgi:putative oxidoreductase